MRGVALKKTVSCIILAMLSISIFTLAINIKSVKGATIIVPNDYSTIQEAIKPPVANFTYSPSISIVGKPTTFNASSSLPGWNGTQEMPITEDRWLDVYPNVTSTPNPIIVRTFPFWGSYNVTLTVTDS